MGGEGESIAWAMGDPGKCEKDLGLDKTTFSCKVLKLFSKASVDLTLQSRQTMDNGPTGS